MSIHHTYYKVYTFYLQKIKMQKKYLKWDNIDQIDQIKQQLFNGQVVVGSSDTVFGLLAATTQLGFESLNSIKNRTEKPYIILIDDIDKLKHFVEIDQLKSAFDLWHKCWPGPLTVIFKAKPNLPDFLKSSDDKIAIRIPKHVGLLKLLANFEGLFSTSANLAGQPVPSLISQLSPQILKKIELVVVDSYNPEDVNLALPSTILDASTGQLKLVREGAYSLELLEQIYGQIIKKN